MKGIGNFFGSIKDKIANVFSSKKKKGCLQTNMDVPIFDDMMTNNEILKIESTSNKKIGNVSKDESKDEINLENMILTQDIIEGCWDENIQTKVIIEKYKKIYQVVEKYLKNKFNQDYKKMAITFIILYYLKKEQANKHKEYMLIMNKAETYLKNAGMNYGDILLNCKI